MQTPSKLLFSVISHAGKKRVVPLEILNAFTERVEEMVELWPTDGAPALASSLGCVSKAPKHLAFVGKVPISGTDEFTKSRISLYWDEKIVTLEGTCSNGSKPLQMLDCSLTVQNGHGTELHAINLDAEAQDVVLTEALDELDIIHDERTTSLGVASDADRGLIVISALAEN